MNNDDTKLQKQFLSSFSDLDDFEGVHVRGGELTVWVRDTKTADKITTRIADDENLQQLFQPDNLVFKYG